jgi:hypothetical protein
MGPGLVAVPHIFLAIGAGIRETGYRPVSVHRKD